MVATTVRNLFDDLLNLEVNIIVKPDVTARKMPVTGESFQDVAGKYLDYLNARRAEGPHSRLPEGEILAGYFVDLSAAADRLLTVTPSDDAGTRGVLIRIKRTSLRLAAIVAKQPDAKVTVNDTRVPLIQEDLLVLRKAWEVGVETVAVQTVAQVDGDVVTRIQPSWATPEHEGLHEVHTRLVSTSLEHWRYLFATVATLAMEVFRGFFRD